MAPTTQILATVTKLSGIQAKIDEAQEMIRAMQEDIKAARAEMEEEIATADVTPAQRDAYRQLFGLVEEAAQVVEPVAKAAKVATPNVTVEKRRAGGRKPSGQAMGDIEFLQLCQEKGTKAAGIAAGMSYKSAWRRINRLKNEGLSLADAIMS